jgi:hypothetical protein
MTEKGSYFAEGSLKSPQIDFSQLSGELILSGRSIPENAAKVYNPLLTVVGEYVKSPREVTNFRLNLDYFNSASLLWFAKIAKTFGSIEKEDALLLIHIYFDMEDYESMDFDEIKDIVCSMIDNIGKVKVSIGVKVYGVGENNKILKEATILT